MFKLSASAFSANRSRHFFRGLVLVSTVLISTTSLATDWYWTDSGGDVWDDNSFGLVNWADSAGNLIPVGSPKPIEGDNAFLVLPYEYTYCQPDGWCSYTPVLVQYRNKDNPTLESVAIESLNILMQWYGLGVDPAYTNLTSNNEYIGGSPYTYTVPPTYNLDPLVSIFPQGEHIQNVGTNRVNKLLQIGGTKDSTGRYRLESAADGYYGTLSVGQMEVIGAEGNGEFEQNGGVHLLDAGSTLIIGQSSTGTGSYYMTSGWLESDTEVIGAAGDGEFTQLSGMHIANQLTIGQQSGGKGTYTLTNGTLSVVTETIGDGGIGSFIQNAGSHYAGSMLLGVQDTGATSSYELRGGTLDVGAETIGDGGEARFDQNGGEHLVDTLQIGLQDITNPSLYSLNSGTLEVGLSMTVGVAGDAKFIQQAGTTSVNTNLLKIASGVTSDSDYEIFGGSLKVNHTLSLGNEGSGTFTQYDGVVELGSGMETALRIYDNNDSYSLRDGTLTVNGGEEIAGTFGQVGGRHEVTPGTGNIIYVGIDDKTGTYNLVDGTLVAPKIIIGSGGSSRGVFNQTGSVSKVETTYLDVGASEPTSGIETNLYQLTDGALQVGSDIQSGVLNIGMVVDAVIGANINIDGGKLWVRGDENIGDLGIGTVTQTSGNHQVDGTLNIGDGATGFYNQSGGALTVNGTENVGNNATGHFKQLDGTHTINSGALVIGDVSGKNGTYQLGELSAIEKPSLEVNGIEKIGRAGTGDFYHYGGTHTVNGELALGYEGGGIGNYTLTGSSLVENAVNGELIVGYGVGGIGNYTQTGGKLIVNEETIGYLGIGTFDQSSGEHIVNGALYIGGNSETVANSGKGTGAYNLSGDGELNVNALLLGYGGLSSQGTFSQTGGSLVVSGHETIGGRDSIAIFNHSAGSNSAFSLSLGNLQDADATYTLSGTGELHVTSDMTINDAGNRDWPGDWGHGEFIQDGDSTRVEIGGRLYINPSLTFGYTLNSGALVTDSVDMAGLQARYGMALGGTIGSIYKSTFAQNGGEHIVNGNVYIRSGASEIDGLQFKFGWGATYHLDSGSLTADEIHVERKSATWSDGSEGWLDAYSKYAHTTVINISGNTLLNEGLTTFGGSGTHTVNGRVENRGEMTVTDTTVDFNGTFINSGEFHSTSSDVQFDQLTVETTGYMTGDSEDVFSVSGDFMNGSLENTLWDTDDVSLIFNGTGMQNFYLAGDDLGIDGLGYQDNFAWGELIINSGVELSIFDGNIFEGAGLYVGAFGLEGGVDTGSLLIDYILSDFNIYYDPTLAANSYLQGLTFALNGEGFLMPSAVPVPPAVWLFGSGLLGLVAVARRKK